MEKINAVLKKKKIDAILLTDPINIRYLSGFESTSGMLLITRERGSSDRLENARLRRASGKFILVDSRYHIAAKKIRGFKLIDTTHDLKEALQKLLKRERVKRLGFEGRNLTVYKFKKLKGLARGVKFVDVSEELSCLRASKTKEEIKLISRAQNITDKIFKNLRKKIKPGMTETKIAQEIEILAHKLNAEDISFSPIVAFGKNSACPHHHPTNKKLKKGEIVLIDMGVKFKGYCSDMTRVLLPKNPAKKNQKILKVYKTLLEAQERAIKNLKAGVKTREIDKLTRKIIEDAGYKPYTHGLGHGIGLEIHEKPSLSIKSKSEEKLPKNTIVTIEPGIYIEGQFGIRLEDMILIKNDDTKNLTKTSKTVKNILY